MIDGKRVLALIPARGGSKGLPRKNVLPLAGKPLIAWTIESARASRYIDRVILTTDDDEIADVGRAWDCEVPFLRPTQLADDNTPAVAVVKHAMSVLPHHDYVVVLQPTSPLRLTADIDACIEDIVRHGAPTLVSVCEVEPAVEWMFRVDDDQRMHPIFPEFPMVSRRQDAAAAYGLNGAVYIGKWEVYEARGSLVDQDTIAYIMPQERSFDVDTSLDLHLCESLMRYRDKA